MPNSTYSVSINAHPGKGELSVLFGGREQTEPNHRVGPQILDYYLVHYVVSGRGRFQSLGQEYELGPGDCFFIFPGELAGYVSDEEEPWSYRWIGFLGTAADQLLSKCGISAYHPVVRGSNRRLAALFHRVQQVLQTGQAAGDLEAGGYLRLILAEWGRAYPAASGSAAPSSEIQKQVDQAIRWLTLQYSQPVSIDHMAQTLGYHRTHLSKIFKQHTGLSPSHFLLKIRMERAKLLLLKPLTVEQAASSVGYPDPLYFSKQFKKWTGLSPTEYRAAAQGKNRYDCSV